MTDYKKIGLLLLDGFSRRYIASSCKVSSKTITKVRKYLDEKKITREDLEKIKDEDLKETISPRKIYKTTKERPDYDAAHIALMGGSSLKSVWEEYNARCKASNINGISYTRFFELVREHEDSLRATKDAGITAGGLVVVKWLNRSVETVDEDGVVGKAYVFMVYFPRSQYIFLYGSEDKTAETTERLISACFDGIGAVPETMMTDNVRCFYSNKGDIRQQLVHLCSHYKLQIASVGTISPQVLSEFGSLTKNIEKLVREDVYQSIDDLDGFLGEIQQIYVSEPVHRDYSREALFKDEVRFMRPVPPTRYEPYREETMAIQYNLHVCIEDTYYSVPYTAYQKDHFVTVRIYTSRIEVYQKGDMIACHRRTSDRYRTDPSHMPPPELQAKLPWNAIRLRNWAACIGPETYRVIDGIISRHPIEQQCYVTCINILKLQDKYGMLLEDACASVSDNSVLYAYKIIKTNLKSRRPEAK